MSTVHTESSVGTENAVSPAASGHLGDTDNRGRPYAGETMLMVCAASAVTPVGAAAAVWAAWEALGRGRVRRCGG
ncbi:hypothetical protein [Streptomyces sp. 4N124]|uniref:hypothetical protein n=1 Tax=Streptomyces sp. 4N124 TaxID=3457420 RepID=UPI003FD114AF